LGKEQQHIRDPSRSWRSWRETPALAFQLFSFSAFQLFSDTRRVILERHASRSLLLSVLALMSLGWEGFDRAAFAQDLTPNTFLQRDRVNNVMIEGTGFPRFGAPSELAPSRRGEEVLPDIEAETSEVADAFGQLAFALVPQALRLRLGLEFRAEYDSNITVGNAERGGQDSRFGFFGQSAAAEMDDFILQGLVNLGMTWQFSGGNALGIDLGLGYRQYLLNPEFSGFVANTSTPGGLAFRFATGDVVWTVFDHFSFNTNPGSQSQQTGVSEYRSFTNTFGFEGAWSISDQHGLRAGLDRTYLSTSSTDQELKRTSDALHLAFVYAVTPLIETGLSGSITFSQDENEFSEAGSSNTSTDTDSTAIAIGPYFRGQITPATEVFLSVGVQQVSFDESNGGGGVGTGSGSDEDPSFYGSLRITNRLTHFYTHSLSIGRDTGLGQVASNSVETDSVRYTGRWNLTDRTSLTGNVFFENSTQGGGSNGGGGSGSLDEKYKLYGGGLTFDVAVRPTVSASLGWQHTVRDSDQEGFDYKRDVVFFSVAWSF
jgi:hypothetical protein